MNVLCIIDPQVDFHEGGALAIPGANADAVRLGEFIDKNAAGIDHIVITMDTHHKLHIAHAAFWQSGEDASVRPEVFSLIPSSDIKSGKWIPRDASLRDYAFKYATELEARGKFQIIIWPEHCLKGSTGHAISPLLAPHLDRWLDLHAARSPQIHFVLKGENRLTEMYSALAAEVPIPDDPSTMMNAALREELLPVVGGKTKHLIVCGQAKSHCVNFTLRDILGPEPDRDMCANVTVLEDCQSSVAGFEEAGDTFINDMRSFGCRIANASDVVV